MMTSFVTVYAILFVGLFGGTGAQMKCYVCTTCAIPFSGDSAGVTKAENCKFCEERNEYNMSGVQTLSTKICVTGVETCTPTLQSTANKTMERKCCIDNFCNGGFSSKSVNITIGLLIVLIVWIVS
ncbi:hypothetical protein P879_04975 [Paragonimus westermani]|uniref:UPAR/Ly6 domain-containing protein n=1 Tax=Paragonimus westermani TaxID=34504 RepID=A0A8T0DQ39_9TREM|nr:hypothetical protein P879_04975 [Paragonimus westermani]